MKTTQPDFLEMSSGLAPKKRMQTVTVCCVVLNLNFRISDGGKMKSINYSFLKFFISLLLSLIISQTAHAQSGWKIISTATNFNSVYFTDSMRGWIVGDSGSAFTTYDGGVSWSGLNSKTKNNLLTVFFINNSTGYAAGNNGIVIKTIDGGESWTQLITGVIYNLRSVYFPSTDTGYAIGEKQIRTTNGGLTWTDYLLTLSANSTFFTSNNTGFYVSASNIFRTTNGGTSWVTTVLTGSFNSIFFENALTGWASGSSTLRYTSNGGANWSVQTPGSGFSTLYGINFSDASSGWTVGSIGTSGGNAEIRRTTNAGINWTAQSSLMSNILRSVSAVTSDQGIAAGDLGTVLLTTNGGSNWINRNYVFTSPASPTYNLNSIHFLNENTGWVTGWAGVVSKTTNGGINWASASSASFSNLNSIYFLDKDTGWVAGNGGTVQMTSNGGTNWTAGTLSSSENINGLHIGKFTLTGYLGLYKLGWCVGNAGVIYKTTNGGVNWISQSSPVSRNLYSVTAFSENNAVICGDSGTILKTTNGGSTWEIKLSHVITGPLRSLSFADNDNGICGGDSAVVLYTTDQGNTWVTDLSGPGAFTKENITSVSAVSNGIISYYAVGEGGAVLYSDNEGITWTLQSGGLKTKLNSISALPTGNCFIAGTKGTILKTSDNGVLPVELSSFNYRLTNKNIELEWSTSQEINNKGFYIERNKDNNNWTSEGFVQGNGTVNSVSNYSFTDLDPESGTYKYRLKQVDHNSNFEFHYLNSEIVIGLPTDLNLYQNYPNPFNPSTTISFDVISENSISELRVTLKIYDISGRELKTLLNRDLKSGHYKTVFYADGFSSGVYFYTLQAGNSRFTKSLVLIK